MQQTHLIGYLKLRHQFNLFLETTLFGGAPLTLPRVRKYGGWIQVGSKPCVNSGKGAWEWAHDLDSRIFLQWLTLWKKLYQKTSPRWRYAPLPNPSWLLLLTCTLHGIVFFQFMKRRSLDSQFQEEIDSGGILTEKWIVPNVPSPPVIRYVVCNLTASWALSWEHVFLYELLTTSVNGYTWNNQKCNTVQTHTVRFVDSNVSANYITISSSSGQVEWSS